MRSSVKPLKIISPFWKIYYWRTRSGVEADFVVYGPLGLWVVEVKNAVRVDFPDLKPLLSFLEDYPSAKAIFLYRGEETFRQNDVLVMPCEHFCDN